MPRLTIKTNLLRERSPDGHARVTYVELFFDLVFVFAITQLSHSLLAHLTVWGAIETALLFLAVWWCWIDTSWVTNWLDPERPAVRLMLLALVLAGLVLSTSLPNAFQQRGLAFAGAYAALQVGRSLFMVAALHRHHAGNARNFQRITIWLAVAAAIWIYGGFLPEGQRLAVWAVALFIEYLSPWVGFWVPGLGRSTTADWDVAGGHLAERCALFVIIALGESILVTGATFAELTWTVPVLAAVASAFVGSVAMWWIYFDTGAEHAANRFAGSRDPGRLARLAYTFIHLLPIAGIVVVAVGDELVLAHPGGETSSPAAAVLLLGPILYLLGVLLFKRTAIGRWRRSHMAGLAMLAGLSFATSLLSPLALGAATTLILVVVGIWESVSLRGKVV